MKIVQPMSILDSNLISSNVAETDYPDWSASTVYVTGDRVKIVSTNTHKIYESLTGKSQTGLTANTSVGNQVNWVAHGLVAGTPVTFTAGSPPTGITLGVVYYVLTPSADAFAISTTVGGSAISMSGSGSGLTAKASTNYGKNPATNPTYWVDAGSTNRWKMFDQSVQSQTTNAGTITVSLATTTLADTIAFLNVDASNIRVKVTHATDGVLYDKTATLTSYLGVSDWYSYFFTPINKQIDVLFQDLPKYAVVTIDITITKISGIAACGVCLLGSSRDISSEGLGVESGAKISIDDYSVKTRDSFGNYTIVQRTFNRRADFTVVIESSNVDAVINLLSNYRATPVLYIGYGDYKSTVVYGFYKSFEVEIAYKSISYCTIQLEGLT